MPLALICCIEMRNQGEVEAQERMSLLTTDELTSGGVNIKELEEHSFFEGMSPAQRLVMQNFALKWDMNRIVAVCKDDSAQKLGWGYGRRYRRELTCCTSYNKQ